MSDERAVATIGRVNDAFDLVPSSLEEAWKLAEMMAATDLVPKDFQGKPAKVLLAVQWGRELGIKPMAAIQNIAVVNGRPSIFGDLGKAVVLGSGLCEDFQITSAEEMKKNGCKARCVLKRKGIASPFVGEFSLEDAKRAGMAGKDNYKNYPERQVQWRAFWYAARDGFADLLKGFAGHEEAADAPTEPRVVTPEVVEMMPRRKSGEKVEQLPERVHFEIQGHQYETAGITKDQMLATFRLAKEVDELHGKNTAAKILREDFAVETRNDLTEPRAAEYIARLNVAAGNPQEQATA